MSQRSSSSSDAGIQLPRSALWIFGMISLLPWLVLLFLGRGLWRPETAAPKPAGTAAVPAASPVFHCKPGPWGKLEYTRILIEPPESLIDPSQLMPRPAAWIFKGYTAGTLTALWHSAGLTAAQLQTIDGHKNWEQSGDGIIIRPTAEFILGLSPATRTKIYSVLAAFAENPDQHEPFRFRAEAIGEWFRDSEIKAETITLIERLLYRRGNSLLFSDASVLLERLPTNQARLQLIKTLARKSTLLVKLRVQADTDFEGLDDYWDRGRRTKDLKPLLQSLIRGTGSATIDIIHLLPRLPRSFLYTYPSANEAGSGSYLDCHWTALNFFNLLPDDRYQHLEAVTAALTHDYYSVTGPRTLGDILLFAKPDGTIIHSCVYIADDIVFTKNGSSRKSPWVLMSLPDVTAYYPSEEPIDLQVYRARDPGATGPENRP